VENINVTNTRVIKVTEVTRVYNTVYVQRDTRVVNNYTYAHNNVAVTAVSRDTFVNARPVSRGIVRVTPDQIQRARVEESTPVAPVRASYTGANAKISNARPGTSFAQRPVVARLTPAVSRPAPVYTNQGRPGNQGQFNRGANSPAFNNNRGQSNGAQPAAPNNSPQQSRDGFRPFQPPANNSQQPNRGGNVQPNNQQQRQNQQQPQSEVRPQQQQLQQRQQEQQTQQQQQQQERQYRYTSPQKARDGNYDVHPPLNQRQEQTARPQQQAQPPRQQAQPKQEERRENNKQDNKKDKQN
jgi:hypothetical protein